MTKTTQELLDDYYHFLSKSYQINKLDDAEEIVTPFTDNIGDNVTLYLSQIKNHKIKLDDDGYTLDNLKMMNVNLSDTRQQLLRRICNQYEVSLSNEGILFNTGTPSDFPIMKLNLTSAILKIGDLSFTQHSRVKKMFVDDVISTLKKKDLGGIPSSFVGRSGVNYPLPYVVPQRKHHPLKVVDVANNISNGNMMQTAFQVNDIKNNVEFDYTDPTFLLIYNEKVASPSKQSMKIANDVGISAVPFSEMDRITDLLTA
ncbi:DUF1828 domain-containing protein [Limosilactobacillus reuteri]|uniref:DUF1828 domain-containing protein n=1 Tax=Limosilactobacillus reuteri TaxID=1598 RepID=UPI001E4B9568|nr:DUF1828 domain-containing protein [Limosilactobacillus reuteri]MCC4325637.1 DUF1828 domain-containing protein [Limosilactobacillus reuteri]MCC4329582.1 DUF1828 domain-containing protein [Limosilactobacillus reuteri]MCC4351216.1 DUF1828 domain-containing protein [Limosilactobacillus reuteri]MCC4376347.1 DUF1828 domain-containing protein [Limosilactobacillus reuteri]MCC4381679.1 DUF1828 domain-containing protein [Limosilactobacillus reuteri]